MDDWKDKRQIKHEKLLPLFSIITELCEKNGFHAIKLVSLASHLHVMLVNIDISSPASDVLQNVHLPAVIPSILFLGQPALRELLPKLTLHEAWRCLQFQASQDPELLADSTFRVVECGNVRQVACLCSFSLERHRQTANVA